MGADEEQRRNLCALENKLPLSLQHYQLRPSFIPLDDFAPAEIAVPRAFDFESWRLAGLQRPLFIFKTPIIRARENMEIFRWVPATRRS